MTRVLELWEAEGFVYLTSPAILTELRKVVQRPVLRARFRADPQPLLDLLLAETEQIPGMLKLHGVCRDAKDDIFLACAVEGHADYLVTGDRDLLDMKTYDPDHHARSVRHPD